MPARKLLFDFGARNFVCRSCRTNLQKSTQWPVRYSSQAVHAQAHPKSNQAPPDQNAERLKTLETLGLVDSGPNVSVNYFEKGRGGGLRRLHSEDEFKESLTDSDGLGTRLKQLEQQLEQATKLIDQLGGKEHTDQLRQPASETNSLPLPPELEQANRLQVIYNVERMVTHERATIVRLNKCIQSACKAVDTGNIALKIVNGLWHAYTSARQLLRKGKASLPRAAYDFLWQVISEDKPFNTNRMSHVYFLAKDMQEAGMTLTPAQQLLAIEAMFISEWQEEAIKNHKRCVSTLGTDPDISTDFWQLGLRMYCLRGDLERAEQMIDVILESPRRANPRFILPYIRACAQSPEDAEKAFTIYRQLRAVLNESIGVEDYNEIISCFLVTSQVDLALCVFVDMMKSGSIDIYRKKEYPPCVANPFFFGKWLKYLIGSGDVESAYKVLLFERSKKIVPPPIQVNGLLGAWFRSGTAINIQKAEDVAWLMINSRIQFVKARRSYLALDDRVSVQRSGDGWPNATLETFCLIGENYRLRGVHAKMEELWAAFREAEIAPDSLMMNQLLSSYLQDGKGQHVAPVYRGLVREYSVKPDPRTFMALWQALPVNRLSRLLPGDLDKNTDETRTLFAEMMKFAPIFSEGVDVFLARRVLHSFRKIDDSIGLLLAYRAFRQILGYTPPEAVAFEVLVGSEDLERTSKGKGWHRLIDARARVDHHLKQKKRELATSGELKEDDELPPELVKQETNNFVELRLEAILVSSKYEGDQVEELVRKAAKKMGLYDEDGADQEGKAS